MSLSRLLPSLVVSIALGPCIGGSLERRLRLGTLLRLTAGSVCSERAGLVAAGAHELDAKLRLWRLDARRAASLLPDLRARGAVAFAQREQSYRVAATREPPDPFQADEWWLAQIGLEGQTAPGPGVPVTIVDSGLDFTHPEFAGRADTLALNAQEPAATRGRARHLGSVGDRRAVERRRARRDLSEGSPALVGRGEGRRHATRVEPRSRGGILAAARPGRSVD